MTNLKIEWLKVQERKICSKQTLTLSLPQTQPGNMHNFKVCDNLGLKKITIQEIKKVFHNNNYEVNPLESYHNPSSICTQQHSFRMYKAK